MAEFERVLPYDDQLFVGAIIGLGSPSGSSYSVVTQHIEYPRACPRCKRPWLDVNAALPTCPFCGAASVPDAMTVTFSDQLPPADAKRLRATAYMRGYRQGHRINPPDTRPRCASCGQLGPNPCEGCAAELR